MDQVKKLFPHQYPLEEEVPDFSSAVTREGETEKTKIIHPTLYIHDAPSDLAKTVNESHAETSDGFWVLAKVYPVRTQEITKVDKKAGETEETSEVELEIRELRLPDLSKPEFHDKDVQDEEDDEDGIISIARAAKKAGVHGIEKETGYADLEDEEESEE